MAEILIVLWVTLIVNFSNFVCVINACLSPTPFWLLTWILHFRQIYSNCKYIIIKLWMISLNVYEQMCENRCAFTFKVLNVLLWYSISKRNITSWHPAGYDALSCWIFFGIIIAANYTDLHDGHTTKSVKVSLIHNFSNNF